MFVYFVPDTLIFTNYAKMRSDWILREAMFITIPAYMTVDGNRKYLGNLYWFFVKANIKGVEMMLFMDDMSDYSGGGRARYESLLELLRKFNISPKPIATLEERVAILLQVASQMGKEVSHFELPRMLPFTEMFRLMYPNDNNELIINMGNQYYVWKNPPEDTVEAFKRLGAVDVIFYYGDFNVDFNEYLTDVIGEAYLNRFKYGEW